LSVSTRPAAFTAATSVVWSFEFTALSTMSFVGYIAAPPTIGFDDMPPLPLMPMPPAQAPSRTETPTAIMSFFIEGSWKEWFLRCLWKPPTARGRDALGSNYAACSRLDSHPFIDLLRVGFAPQQSARCLRIACAARHNPPFVFQPTVFSPRLATTNLPGDNTHQ
jgi:hypothetical protein